MTESWRHGWAEAADGVRLHYVTQGEGPLVLLLHGFPEHWFSWRHQIPALAEAGFRVVAPDLRGYNLSDKPPRVADYSMDRLTADVRALVHGFGEERAVIVGHDWGGGVAWAVAAHHPEVTERLVVLNCPHPEALGKAIFERFEQMRRSWYMFFFQLPWLPEWLLGRNQSHVIERMFRGMAVRKEAFPPEDLRRYVEAMGRPRAAASAVNYYRAAFRDFLASGGKERYPKIAADTLLIWGEQDIALGKELTYGLDRYCAGEHRVSYLPEASHWVQQDAPEEVNRLMLEFLAKG